jgi:hypothetical protein
VSRQGLKFLKISPSRLIFWQSQILVAASEVKNPKIGGQSLKFLKNSPHQRMLVDFLAEAKILVAASEVKNPKNIGQTRPQNLKNLPLAKVVFWYKPKYVDFLAKAKILVTAAEVKNPKISVQTRPQIFENFT